MDKIASSQDSLEEISKEVTLFENPFAIEDLMVFDDATMRRLFGRGSFCLRLEDLAWSLQGASNTLRKRVRSSLPAQQRVFFAQSLRQPMSGDRVNAARKRVLDALFWELTYWKTPELYEELTEGECLHPGIFEQLEPDLRGKTVLDVGAGSGRATFECVHHGSRLIYAVEPSPGLLRILKQKLASRPDSSRVIACRGHFDQIPLDNQSVDISLSCSAFTAEPEHGGEAGLIELQRVTKPGGKIVLIWPRREDYEWLVSHGFQYVSLPLTHEMLVRFRSLPSALRCARLFYAHNGAVVRYILKKRQPEVPFSVLGSNPPCDYCWLTVN
ncbi:MAG: hypothetical protein NVSMB27_32610 [Ktedonobacteraceae bacterium]